MTRRNAQDKLITPFQNDEPTILLQDREDMKFNMTLGQGKDLFSQVFYKKTPIRTVNIKNFSERYNDNVSYRCDYMSIIANNCGELSYADIFDLNNNTNSNIKIISLEDLDSSSLQMNPDFGSFTVQSVPGAKNEEIYIISVVFRSVTIPLYRFVFYGDNHIQRLNQKLEARIDIYGEHFRLEEITGGLFSPPIILALLLGEYGQYLEDFYITRYDYKIDFFVGEGEKGLSPGDIFKTPKGTNKYFSETPKNKQPYGIKQKDGSLYTGWTTPNSTTCKTRFYHKKADIQAKGKQVLYTDYIDHPGEVRRLEFQFNSRFCSGNEKFGFFQEYKQSLLYGKIMQYLGLAQKTKPFSRRYMLQEVAYDRLTLEQKQREYNRALKLLIRIKMGGGDVDRLYGEMNNYLGFVKEYGEENYQQIAMDQLLKFLNNDDGSVKTLSPDIA